MDIPSLAWPKADFPKYRYPLEENVAENEAEDSRCLAMVEELLAKSVSLISLTILKSKANFRPEQGKGSRRRKKSAFFYGFFP